jgi:hypothetical protein
MSWLLAAMLAGLAAAQQPPPDAANRAAAEVLALEQKIEAAVVRGDVTFVDSVLSDDFRFVHGDGWTTGGKPLMEDDKAAFSSGSSRRNTSRPRFGQGRSSRRHRHHTDADVSLAVPGNRSGNPGQLNSIWFERVYARRDGQWKFLSHRTVHGPTVSPAGIDPTAARPRP